MDDINEAKYLLEKLVGFNTENFDEKPSGYTLGLLKFVQNYLEKNDIQSNILPYTIDKKIDRQIIKLKDRGILVTTPKKDNRPTILLEGHCDTVPISEEGVIKPIFRAQRGQMIGRGTVDMKGSIVSMILTIKELSKLQNLKYQPALLITSDEEANDFAGIKYFLEQQKKHKYDIRLAICGEPTDFEIKTNFYGAIYIIIKFLGKSGHGAYGKKSDNAIINSITLLNKLVNYQEKVCKIHNDNFGYSTMNIGIIHGGEKVNQTPPSCTVEFAIRTVKSNNIYEKLFNDIIRDKNSYNIEKVFSYNPLSISDKDKMINTLKKALLKENKTQKNKLPSIKEFTEATFLNRAGIKTIVFGPGNPSLSHSSSERIDIKDVLMSKKVLKEFFLSL